MRTSNSKKSFSSGRKLLGVVFALMLWLTASGTVWAAAKKKQEVAKPAEQGYLLAYVVTLTAITLGVAAVCFPSQRKNDVNFREED